MLRIPAVLILTMFYALPASAQRTVAPSVTVSGLVSLQPQGYDGTGGPYLDNSLKGTEPGFSAALDLSRWRATVLALELSTTTQMEASQRGRFVIGPQPALARHRDTLLSVLAGPRVSVGSGAIEPKGGISFVLGTFGDAAGEIAFTAGVDAVAPIDARAALVPSVRYSLIDRGDEALYLGLGRHILRAGIGVRFTMGPG